MVAFKSFFYEMSNKESKWNGSTFVTMLQGSKGKARKKLLEQLLFLPIFIQDLNNISGNVYKKYLLF